MVFGRSKGKILGIEPVKAGGEGEEAKKIKN